MKSRGLGYVYKRQPSASAQNEEEVVAAIVGAIVAMGYSSEQIASIRPTATSAKWRLEGRLSGRG